jgi:uncharacterized protein YraI
MGSLLAAVLCSLFAEEARQVTVSELNVRSGPGTGYSILGLSHSGEKYVVVTTSGSWKKIWWAGNTGWIYTGYTSAASGTGSKVTASALNVRTGPGTSYSAIGQAHQGEIYVLAGTSGSWDKIWFGGAARWFHGDYTSGVSLGGSTPSSGSQRYYPTAYELDIFRRTVMAESGGEPYAGQAAVAAVILNRIASPNFPNTMHGVIFQPYQFTPATTGQIWNVTPSQSVKDACQAALNWSDPSYGALYFYAWCSISPPSWAYTKTWTVTIGCHKFYK